MMKKISIFLFAAAALLGAGCDDSSDTDKVIPVSAIALDTSLSGGISLVVGQTADIAGKVTVRPENATDKTETYESSDPETVSVDDAGVVKAVKPGLAMVTISVGGKHSHFEVEVREQRISVESVTLPAELADGVTLKLGATLDIAGKATITPSNATDKTESYNSSNPMIASVTEEGIVSAIAVGEATITISVDGQSAQFTLTVEKIAVESVTLPDEWKDGYTMPLSGTLELAGKAAVLPENASNRAESYDSSDKEVATVSAEGVVTPLKAGKTTISITIDGVSASFELTVAADVQVDLEKIEIKNGATPIQGSASVALGANTTFDLYSQLQLTPANQTEGVKYVAYGPEEIATIDENGIVTCKGVGTVTFVILAKSNENNDFKTAGAKKAYFAVNITDPHDHDRTGWTVSDSSHALPGAPKENSNTALFDGRFDPNLFKDRIEFRNGNSHENEYVTCTDHRCHASQGDLVRSRHATGTSGELRADHAQLLPEHGPGNPSEEVRRNSGQQRRPDLYFDRQGCRDSRAGTRRRNRSQRRWIAQYRQTPHLSEYQVPEVELPLSEVRDRLQPGD